MVLLGTVKMQLGILSSSKQKEEQEKLRRQQQAATNRAAMQETAANLQKTNLALGAAQQRPTGMTPSFSGSVPTGQQSMGTSALGNLQPQSQGSATSGTF
jgi:hypothetical protein